MKKPVVILGILVMLTACSTNVSEQKMDERVTFEDNRFEQLIRSNLNKPQGDISPQEMKKIRNLTDYDHQISSLKGIEYCTNLENLLISHVKISELKRIKNQSQIKILAVGDLTIDTLDFLTSCSSLKELRISSAQINGLNEIERCKFLKLITFNHCIINSLGGLNKSVSVKNLDFYGGEIKNIAGAEQCKSLKNVIIQGCKVADYTQIGSLCEINKIMSINLSHNNLSSLEEIIPLLGKARIKKLTVTYSNLKNLKGLDKVKEIDDYQFRLNVSHNQLTNINGIEKKYCKYIDISNNQITDISPLCVQGYEYLYCKNNPIKCYSPAVLINDPPIDCKGDHSDITLPKSEKGIKINSIYICLDQSPEQIEHQDIFVSPKYLLSFFGYQCEISRDCIKLTCGRKEIIFRDKGKTMIFNGKTYRSPYPVFEKNGITYIPLKYYVQKLGGSVTKVNRDVLLYDYKVKLPSTVVKRDLEWEKLEEENEKGYLSSYEEEKFMNNK